MEEKYSLLRRGIEEGKSLAALARRLNKDYGQILNDIREIYPGEIHRETIGRYMEEFNLIRWAKDPSIHGLDANILRSNLTDYKACRLFREIPLRNVEDRIIMLSVEENKPLLEIASILERRPKIILNRILILYEGKNDSAEKYSKQYAEWKKSQAALSNKKVNDELNGYHGPRNSLKRLGSAERDGNYAEPKARALFGKRNSIREDWD